MTKKILIFSLAYYPNHVGGAEAAIREITDRIDKTDIEFHMICLRFDSNLPRTEKIGNVLIHRIGFTKPNPGLEELRAYPLHLNKYYFQFFAFIKAILLHRKHNYDATWAMMAHSSGIPAALFKLFHPEVPYALTLQEGDPIEHIEKTMKPVWPLFTRAFRSANVVQAISTYLADWARERGFKGPLEKIHNGGNPGDFAANFSEEELIACKKKVGKGEGDILLVTASRLVDKNAVDDVIRSLTYLEKNIKFLVLGGGPDEADLKQLTKDLDLENRVIFLGQIDRTDVPRYRKISDVFVRPSRSEGLGNAMISAMAARLPVVATQEGGIAEFLFDEKRNPDKKPTGWAVNKNNPKQIAEAVKNILENKEKTKSTVDNAHKLVSAKYNWDQVAKDMRKKIFTIVLN